MKTGNAVFWVVVYLGLLLAPMACLLLAPSPRGAGFWTDFSIALGFSALAIMGAQFVLTSRFRRAAAPFGIDLIYYFHRLMAIAGFGLIIAHVVIILAARPALLKQILSADMPRHTLPGLASLLLFCVLLGASIWRKRLGIRYESWRRWHGALAVLAIVLAVIHVLFAGYYINEPWKRGLWTVITVSWVALLVYVRIVKPLRMLKHPWRIASVQPESGNAWTVTVVPEGHAGMAFLPGQFAWLTVARSPFSLSEHPFSIASSAAPGGPLEFTIKELGDFTRTIKNIQPNTRAYLDGPYGAFTTDYFPDAAGFVFVAGGVGIAPIMSMLRTLAVRKDPRPMWLFYGNRVWEGVIFRDEIESLREVLSLQVVHVLQEPPPEWAGETGLLNAALFRRLLPPAAFAFEVFVCGPKPMLSLVERALHTAGMPLTRIHSELFDLA